MNPQGINQKPKLAIVTTMWKRPDLTRRVFSYYKKISELFAEEATIQVFAAGSEGDASHSIAREYGVTYTEVDNFPLSFKQDTALRLASRWNPDGYLFIGSDDVCCPKVIAYYLQQITTGVRTPIGFKDIYFEISGELYYYQGYQSVRAGESIGAGRFFPRNIIVSMGFKLWGDRPLNRGMDYAMTQRLRRHNVRIKVVSLKDIDGHIIGMQNDANITKRNPRHYQPCPYTTFEAIPELTEFFNHKN